jgi:hypothetical protein
MCIESLSLWKNLTKVVSKSTIIDFCNKLLKKRINSAIELQMIEYNNQFDFYLKQVNNC